LTLARPFSILQCATAEMVFAASSSSFKRKETHEADLRRDFNFDPSFVGGGMPMQEAGGAFRPAVRIGSGLFACGEEGMLQEMLPARSEADPAYRTGRQARVPDDFDVSKALKARSAPRADPSRTSLVRHFRSLCLRFRRVQNLLVCPRGADGRLLTLSGRAFG